MKYDHSIALKLYDKNKPELSIKRLSKRIVDFTDDPYSFEYRAMSYYHLGDYENCLADMNAAQNLQPNNPFRYSSRAYVKNKIGDFDGAIEDYQKAVHLDPEDAIAYNNLGLAMESKGYSGKAKSHFDKADELAANTTPKSNFIKKEVDPYQGKDSTIKYAFTNVTKSKFLKEFMQFLRNGFKLTK